MQLLFDNDVRSKLGAAAAVSAARRAVVDAYRGALAAPPRLRADFGENSLVFSAGGYAGGALGFRVYGLWPRESDQAVLVWDRHGRLEGCVVGSELGARRTGALGGVAVDALARADASTLGIVGSGSQAWTQLWAITAVRTLTAIRIFSPTRANRERFAERAQAELGLSAAAVDTPEEAVANADLVVLATTPPELAERARSVVSDSPAQAAAYGEPFFTPRELTNLGAVVAGDDAGRTSDDGVTLYCSTGLAGSEVVLAETLLSGLG